MLSFKQVGTDEWHPAGSLWSIVGMIPEFADPSDPRPAAEQFDAAYQHGGGWKPYTPGDWVMSDGGAIQYKPGEEDSDPPLVALAEARLRDETIRVYDMGLVSITQPDGSFQVSRMD